MYYYYFVIFYYLIDLIKKTFKIKINLLAIPMRMNINMNNMNNMYNMNMVMIHMMGIIKGMNKN